MVREILGGKIHGATITQANLEYTGSCDIDRDLLDAAGIVPYERVHIYNISMGARLSTYAIPVKRGSGIIGLNGAAARLGQKGDRIIIVNYIQLEEEQLSSHQPIVVVVDEKNRPVKNIRHRIGRS